MDQADITARVKERFGDRILAHTDHFGQHAVTVRPDTLVELAVFLRDEADLAMDFLTDLGGVDYLGYEADGIPEREWRFEVAYQFYSMDLKHRYRVKVAVEDDSIHVPTLASIWRTANWLEREVYDQFGIVFDGHKNLRRILNHDEFVGHPLRKDYPIDKRQPLVEMRNVPAEPTQRHAPVEKLNEP